LWMLLTGSATLYLASMDILFDVENGIYWRGNAANVAVEVLINLACLGGSIAVIAFAWRNRRHLT